MIRHEFNKRDIRSYVIRGGRMTASQKSAFDKHWPNYGLHLADGCIDSQKIFNNDNPLIVEIGYGMGDSLIAMAKNNPQQNFIGIEVHPPGVGRLINEAANHQLSNIKTYCADAIDILNECIPEESLSRVQLYFPDPWHKKKHNKRRIVQPEFASLVAKHLKVGGIFHLCTDWQNYAEAMIEVMNTAEDFNNLSTDNTYCEQPNYRPTTKFETRGANLGHGVWDLLYEKS